jgi:preprotein translocase subunit Sss1
LSDKTHDFLEAGIQGNEDGVIIDLGTEEDIQAKYPYESHFINIYRWEGIALRPLSQLQNLVNRQENLPDYVLTIKVESNRFQPEDIGLSTYYYMANESQILLSNNRQQRAKAAIQLGHVYLVSIFQGSKQLYLGKFKVIDYDSRTRAVLSYENLFVDYSSRICDKPSFFETNAIAIAAVVTSVISLLGFIIVLIILVVNCTRARKYARLQ